MVLGLEMSRRRNRQQYELLSDFDRATPQRSRLVEQTYRPSSWSEQYGSCSVMSTMDRERDSLPLWRCRGSLAAKITN
ncbi:hypothetical protein TNCV_301541 [Trichonephila clavipes]|nr:hypothetical protein TNCV_301541 [Trichonephila clavipes]